jgi:hypothetical protein
MRACDLGNSELYERKSNIIHPVMRKEKGGKISQCGRTTGEAPTSQAFKEGCVRYGRLKDGDLDDKLAGRLKCIACLHWRDLNYRWLMMDACADWRDCL